MKNNVNQAAFCLSHCCQDDVTTGCPLCQDWYTQHGFARLQDAIDNLPVMECGTIEAAFHNGADLDDFPIRVSLACSVCGCPNKAVPYGHLCRAHTQQLRRERKAVAFGHIEATAAVSCVIVFLGGANYPTPGWFALVAFFGLLWFVSCKIKGANENG